MPPINIVASKSQKAPLLPPGWASFFDNTVPNWVKLTYLHEERRETYERKLTFGINDAKNCSNSVLELSQIFSNPRKASKKKGGKYFESARFRSSYLLYFFPHHAHRFLTVYHRHRNQILAKAKGKSTVRILDIGSGPGTASISFMFFLSRLSPNIKFHFTWVDTSEETMNDGEAIIENSTLKSNITITKKKMDWQDMSEKDLDGFDLILFGNILNESPKVLKKPIYEFLNKLKTLPAIGVLFFEPATEENSRTLMGLRRDLLTQSRWAILGPCLHTGKCPLIKNQNWCHFSFAISPSGKWYSYFSREISSSNKERTWAKFSYVWAVPKTNEPAPEHQATWRLLLSDTLKLRDGKSAVLSCEPKQTQRIIVKSGSRFLRGDLIKIKPKKMPAAKNRTPS